MKVIFSSGSRLPVLPKSACAIGIFDGMHRGHRLLIGRMVSKARRLNAVPAVITFFPHPAHVLSPTLKLGYLSSLNERLAMMRALGVKLCVVVRFSKDFARIEPEDFIRRALVGRLRARAVFVGEEFRFGRGRKGDVALFKRLAPECGYSMHAVKVLDSGGHPISSTRIRGMVAQGDLACARRLLGRSFSVSGRVVKGDGRGKSLGFATANVAGSWDVLPPLGVYAVRVGCQEKTYSAVANLGLRPTFKSRQAKPQLEVHIFDFNRSLYGQTLTVYFIKHIRPERRFANPQELIRQVKSDIRTSSRILQRR